MNTLLVRAARLTPVVAAWLVCAPLAASAACPTDASGLLGAPAANPVGSYPVYMATADFNGDGREDVALAEYNANQLSVYLNFPDPASSAGCRLVLGARATGLSSARDCAVGDFDGNGVPDIAVVSLLTQRVHVLRGSRTSSGYALAAPVSYALASLARSISIADLEGDGIEDLVVGADNGVYVLRGQGSPGVGNGAFGAPQAYEAGRAIFSVAIADLNADGALDLGCIFGPTSGGAVLFGQTIAGHPTGTFGAENLFTFPGLPKRVHAADMNADGRPDLVVGVDPGVVVVQNTTIAGANVFDFVATRFQNGTSLDNTNDVAILDLDHDGVLDVVLPSSGSTSFTLMQGAISGGAWTKGAVSTRTSSGAAMVGTAVGDWNGDAQLDVAIASITSGALALHASLCGPAPAGEVAVTAVAHGPGTVTTTPPVPSVAPGTPVLCEATPDPGAQFLGWSGALSGASASQTLTPASDAVVRGWFATAPRTIDLQIEGSGTVQRSLDLPAYSPDAGFLLLARPGVGATFSHWSGLANSTDTLLSLGAGGSGALIAHFFPAAYTVQAASNTYGHNSVVLDPPHATFGYGDQVILTAVPEFGFTFTRWSGLDPGESETLNPTTITVTRNRSITAVFTPVNFPVTITTLGLGSVGRSPSDAELPYLSTFSLWAYPVLGYRFLGWSGDIVSQLNSLYVTVTGPMHITAMFEGDPGYLPYLTSLADVPSDQGGLLRARWSASLLDRSPASITDVNRYYVWRSVPTAAALAALGSGAAKWEADEPGESVRQMRAVQFGATTTYWEYVTMVPATQLGFYTTTVPTESDSSSAGLPWTQVFVQARSVNNELWWNSPVDSMYSVDNIAPPPPSGLTATRSLSGLHLVWAASWAADMAGYRVYRGHGAAFVTDASTLVGSTTSTQFDLSGAPEADTHVKVVAVDQHDNPSAPAVLTPATLDALTRPAGFALAPPRPNPARGELDLQFSLERSGDASVEVLDVSGRVVARRSLPDAAAGAHAVTVAEARALPAGLYFVRLVQGERREQRRVVIAR